MDDDFFTGLVEMMIGKELVMNAAEHPLREQELSFEHYNLRRNPPHNVVELPRVSTRLRVPTLALGKRKRTLRQVVPLQKRQIFRRSLAATLVLFRETGIFALFAIFFFLELFGDPRTPLMQSAVMLMAAYFVFLAIFCGARFAYEICYYLTYSYDMDLRTLTVRKGVIVRRESILPLSRITDVYIDQDYLGVLFGLYDVHVSTPTLDSGRFAHFDGINRRGAIKLRQLLLKRVG